MPGPVSQHHEHRSRRRRARAAVTAALMLATSLTAVVLTSAPAQALAPVNPVRVAVGGHPANSGFLVFVEGDVSLRSDESEGTMAAGGDLVIRSNYNIAAGSPPVDSTFTAPGDSGPTFLYVGGGIHWPGTGAAVNVENSGFTKVAETSTYSAFNRDNNNALVNYRLVPKGSPYNSSPFIDGRTNAQTPASIATPVPSNLIDIPAAFATYRNLTVQMAACPATVTLTDAQGNPTPRPVAPGTSARITLTPGQTNVLTLTAAELVNLSELTFTNQPSASTPILINITGGTFSGDIPNLAGVSGSQAPYMMWNFPTASSITVTGGATIEGTIYAPNATLTWLPTQNVEGNVIAADFNHGQPGRTSGVRELHDFPFATTLSCATPQAHLTLVKQVINDNGGTAAPTDWMLRADGPTPLSGTSGSAAVTNQAVTPGDYTLSEIDGPDGYTPSDWSCTGGTLDGATLTLADGNDATCTITNDDQPVPIPQARLTLVKEVINDDGGTAQASDWTLSAAGPTTGVSGPTGDPAVTNAAVEPGTYDLSESGPTGYTSSRWLCVGASQSGSTVSLADGDTATCVIVNNDDPPPLAHLTLIKDVVNDNGGTALPTDWQLSADGPTPITGVSGDPSITAAPVTPGTYDLSETGGPTGYDASDWTCTGASGSTASSVTVADGDSTTCTITNNDTPAVLAHLTLVKQVINNDGGTAQPTDWQLTAQGPTTITGTTGSAAVTDAEVGPGSYDLSESGGPAGYDASDWTCTGAAISGVSVDLSAGDVATCTIVNDDIPATVLPTTATTTSGGGGSAGQPTVSPESLVRTGADIAPEVGLAMLLLLGGAGLVLLSRRASASRRH